MGIMDVTTVDQFNDVTSSSKLTVVHFWAPWSQPSVDMNNVLETLNPEYPDVQFVKVQAEELPDISMRCEVSAVPTFVFFRVKKAVDRLGGANVPEFTKRLKQLAAVDATPEPLKAAAPVSAEALNEKLKGLIESASVMLFMKGDPQTPRCGFSRQIVALLNENKVTFSTFDILTDDQVRQGLKKYSDWPTFPQLYIKGELAGGLDIAKELVANGELKEMVA
ncbi:glutaredoxin-3-like [Sycon ciliatum]|uniref:glutaredoxin-3-like n=1 Tax=Sycon ciliatum TaxID=27933 RepID=UPI0020AB998D|eukprot:scpid63503/ scgid8267/ Glutaredoxin-3; Thioredoxin-like protein 2